MNKLIALALLASLFGCAGNEHADLRQWMADNTKDLRGSIPKLPDVKPYEPVPYGVESQVHPFHPDKVVPESKLKTAGKGSPYQPDFEARERRNSILEKYPLESLKMLGYLNVNRQPLAVIQVDDKVKQIKVGEYLGMDFGMVVRILENEVHVRELVQDASGDWSERESVLRAQTVKEGSKK